MTSIVAPKLRNYHPVLTTFGGIKADEGIIFHSGIGDPPKYSTIIKLKSREDAASLQSQSSTDIR